MRTVKALNISNTYRSANINTLVRPKKSQILDYHKLNQNKFHKLYVDFQKLKKQKIEPSKLFIGKHYDGEDMNDMNVERQIALDGFPFRYYSNTTFPEAMILACHSNKHAICMYNYHGRLSDETISSMFRASQICRIGVNIPIILGVTSLLASEVWLFASRFLLERAELNFVGLTKKQINTYVPIKWRNSYKKYGKLYYPDTKARLMCYSKLHEVFARWKYQLYIYCESQKQADTVYQKGLKIANE